jgi:hypothetical protein
METTVQGVDAKAYLGAWLGVVTGMCESDIAAIPDDKWTATHGGCTRTCGAMIADTVTNLNWTTGVLKGEESDAYSHMATLALEYEDKAKAIAGLNEASAALGAALAAASDERLNESVMAPWQMPAPVFMLAQIAVSHVWYHDGQLNYVQTVLGDDKVHWMPPTQ